MSRLSTFVKMLAAHGVGTLTADFNGGGDSGQIEGINLEGIADPKAFMALEVPHAVQEEFNFRNTEKVTFGQLIDHELDGILEACGYDWYNNDGGSGTITVVPGEADVAKQLVVDMGINISSTHNYKITLTEEGGLDHEDRGVVLDG